MSSFVALFDVIVRFWDATAWPIVALILAVVFRVELRGAVARLVEWGPAKFSPAPPEQATANEPTLEALATPPPDHGEGVDVDDAEELDIQRQLTPTTRAMWDAVGAFPYYAQQQTDRGRITVLRFLLARALLFGQFEQIEGAIWASQIELLAHLAQHGTGVNLDELERRFYAPAARSFPDWFKSCPFQAYWIFLEGQGLVARPTPVAGQLTSKGDEYLRWRFDQRKLPKTFG